MKKFLLALVALIGISNVSHAQNSNFEYVAFIMCGSARTALALCLVDGNDSNNTSTLDLTNFNQRNVYSFKNIGQAGPATKSGVGIRLSQNFKLTIKNVNQSVGLLVTIYKKDDQNNPVFQQEARYGQTINVSN